jgi:hypothetical protein
VRKVARNDNVVPKTPKISRHQIFDGDEKKEEGRRKKGIMLI